MAPTEAVVPGICDISVCSSETALARDGSVTLARPDRVAGSTTRGLDASTTSATLPLLATTVTTTPATQSTATMPTTSRTILRAERFLGGAGGMPYGGA